MAAIVGVWWLRRRRRADAPRSILELERALRAAKLALRPGETPRELLARAVAAGVASEQLAAVREAAAAHERDRYRS
ncbi:MAG: DUF4129 domain-containing protein [Planctomycetes bacterium]|nr:DUF4129 domain-containing protein [Planctomycetota bacterium]